MAPPSQELEPPINPGRFTHAHLDHSGYLPLLIKNGYRGQVYCSHSTVDFCEILLTDSGYLQEKDAEFANRVVSRQALTAPVSIQRAEAKGIHFGAWKYEEAFDWNGRGKLGMTEVAFSTSVSAVSASGVRASPAVRNHRRKSVLQVAIELLQGLR